jgi:hypothetical protein
VRSKCIWEASPGAPYGPVLKLNESVPHHGAAADVVFAATATAKADTTAVAAQAARTAYLGTIPAAPSAIEISTLVGEP